MEFRTLCIHKFCLYGNRACAHPWRRDLHLTPDNVLSAHRQIVLYFFALRQLYTDSYCTHHYTRHRFGDFTFHVNSSFERISIIIPIIRITYIRITQMNIIRCIEKYSPAMSNLYIIHERVHYSSYITFILRYYSKQWFESIDQVKVPSWQLHLNWKQF